jgi:molybdate transport system substrate-binding protein
MAVVMAAEQVPAGRYARAALRSAGVELAPASLEPDVRAVLSRVALGEADAGIVYRSDLLAATGAVEGVAVPPEHNVTAAYPIAALAAAPNPGMAAAFLGFVTSAEGRAILAEHGFTAP